MNKELFHSMRKQMNPSPEARTALSERLARTTKKRPVPWMRYGAVAACAALVIGAYTVYQIGKPRFYPLNRTVQLHSYVTVDGMTGYVTENTGVSDLAGGLETGAGGAGTLPVPNTGVLPYGAHVGDVPVQEGAEDYQRLMDHFNGTLPDWYGGAYIDRSGWLVVQLVENQDPADKSLELQVLDWTGSGHVMFSSCKYSLAQLNELMDRLNALPDTDLKCGDIMAGWGIDEEHNRIELTLTEVNYPILAVLAEMDPDDNAIYVQVGQRASIDDALGEVVSTDSARTEEPVSHGVMPGGVVPPVPEDDGDLIAGEPWVDDLDGIHFATEDGGTAHRDILELPESKQPAAVQSVPEEDSSGCTLAYDPDVGFIYPNT